MINEFLKKYFPKLNDFFIRNDFSISNFVHKWLVTIFSECYMEETTYLIWDFLFLEGNIVLIKTCLIIFCILKRKLLKFEHNFEELYSILSFDTEKIDPKTPTLLYGLSFKKFEFTDEYIEETRDLLSFSVIKNIDNDNIKKFEMNKKMKKLNEKKSKEIFICNENWPICEYNKSKEEPNLVIKYLVLHHKNEPKKISDYFFNYTNSENKKLISQIIENENDKTKDEENLKEEEYYDILIERQEHCCIGKDDKEESIINIGKNILPKFNYHKSECSFDALNTSLGGPAIIEKSKEIPVYRRISKNKEYQSAKEKIRNEFSPKPYVDEFSFDKRLNSISSNSEFSLNG